MPNRHSLFWRLALVLVAFFLLSVWLSWTWGRSAELKGYYLSAEARSALADYARRAERAWLDDGREGIDRWLAEPRQQALDWVVVLDGRLQSLGSRPLTTEEAERLTFLRGVDWPMSSRSLSRPFISLRFPEHPEQGRVVLRLPAEFVPPGLSPAKRLVTHGLVPAGLALLLGVLLYRRWVVPLGRLRAQANALRGNDLTARTQAEISRRSDELGDLGRAFDHMAERLDEHMVLQRQLLRDLSHELRTPLARLQVAAEGTLPAQLLRERLEQEVQGMQQLVDNTLELAWMDTERPVLALEDISIPALWDLLVENARFESGWA
ncbi:TPA: histidine kinase sensor domain-containing protein, partial [Pseudomonas aeruginosa]|nr:histidine kinase sensor domain-containing protein [Pseudomonas aeruginosa]